MKAVFSLVPDNTLLSLHNILTNLFSSVCRKAVHYNRVFVSIL